MIFQNSKIYDVLKYIALIAIPAFCFFLNSVGEIWSWENITKITATISAVGVLLGALLQISSAKFHKENQPPDEEE